MNAHESFSYFCILENLHHLEKLYANVKFIENICITIRDILQMAALLCTVFILCILQWETIYHFAFGLLLVVFYRIKWIQIVATKL